MKICLVSQQYPPDTAAGGIGTQTMLKAQHLARRGHTVHVVSSTLDGPARVARDGDVTVHRLPYPTVDTPFCETSVLWIGFSYAVAAKLADLTERIDFDLIEFPEYGAEGFVYQIERPQPRRVSVVVMLHGSLAMFAERVGWPEPDSDLWRVGAFLEEQAILKADLLLAASHNIAAFWQARLGDRLPPVEV